MRRALLAFVRKELAQTLRDPRMRVVLFVLPMVQMTVFGLAISTEVRGIRLAVVHRPGDAAARALAERFHASGWFLPVDPQGREPFSLVESGAADAVLVAPPEGLSRALGRGGAAVQLLIEATNATKARAVESYAAAILARPGPAAARELGAPPPGPRLEVRVLYNPSMESSLFMVPGVMGMIVCIVTIMLTSMSLAKERETGTFETIISAPLHDGEILLGKTLPYVLLGVLDTALVFGAGTLLFGVPLKGPVWMLGAAALAFVGTTVGIGTLISTVSRTQQQAMMGSFLFLFPATLMSGIMFPLENMPPAIIGVAYLNPLKYFVVLMRNITLKGGDPQVFASNVAVLLLMMAAVASLSYRRFRQTLD